MRYHVIWTGTYWYVHKGEQLLARATTKGEGIEFAEKDAGRHLGWDFSKADEAVST